MSTYKLPDENGPEEAREPDTRATYVRRSPPGRTRVVGAAHGPEATPADEDPVSGWLVIIKGPGAGEVVTLGYGMHTIGRSHDNRVQLEFGDQAISGTDHFRIIYELKTAAFYVQHGVGKNLIEVNGETVLDRTPLPAAALIQVGDTVLRFTPFCTPDFNWQKLPA